MTGQDDDVAFKILHTADWHLGRTFPSFEPGDERTLMRARLDAVVRMLDLAEQYRVSAVLVCGDTFDEPQPQEVWWRGLLECLTVREWSNDRQLIFLPGNHDPLMPSSIWAPASPFRQQLPKWVTVIEETNTELELSPEVALYASPCFSQAGSTDLALGLPDRVPGDHRIRIGMIHGRSFRAEGHQTNFPLDPEAARLRKLDYLALGDQHAWQFVGPRNPTTLYPGAPEPATFAETESGSCAIVFFKRRTRQSVVTREKVGQWQWRQETVTTIDALRELRNENLSRVVLRLAVDIELLLPDYEEAQQIITEFAGTEARLGRVGVLQLHDDRLTLDTSGIEDHFDALPEVFRTTAAKLKVLEKEQPELARRALWHLTRLTKALRA